MNNPIPEQQEEIITLPDLLPVLPLKDTVVFPYIIVPLSIGRDKSVLAVDEALTANRIVMLAAQKEADTDDPEPSDVHELGTAAVIMRMLKLPDGRIRILVQGLTRARIQHFSHTEPYLQAKIERLDDPPIEAPKLEVEALVRSVKDGLDRVVQLGKAISSEVAVIAANLEEPGRLADLVASNMDLKSDEAQEILRTLDPVARLRLVNTSLAREVQVLTMQQEISTQARGEMDKSQRDYFLRQQLKAIRQELGEGEDLAEDLENYRSLADEKGLPEEAQEELERQLKKLERTHPESAETAIIRSLLDWMTALPWSVVSEDILNLDRARRVLDEDHYDLEEVKDRILEYLAVRKLNPQVKGPILCFVGPPGVGKTSLGRSIARAMNRKFLRISLGGVRDEAEIRGHRRTYVGALPGRILQGLRQCGTNNPVFMLDEIDKLGTDYRGDPSSALLEVLDPEQNFNFRDHYLSVAYDLSKVMFITTANQLQPIQPAFRDRMEVIRLSGYIEEEKIEIAKRHLIPKQVAEHGLADRKVTFTTAGIRKIIRHYTKEAGLRNLERELAKICRKTAVKAARGKLPAKVSVSARSVEDFLGAAKHFSEELLDRNRIGVATGLAWTPVGGDLMFVEVAAVPGKGRLVLTGQLGGVMKESAQAAITYARSSRLLHEAPADFFANHDIHIHVPAGSVPKDGPSAGITIAAAVVSLLTGRAVDRRVAMTGEITLRGDVLPIGGLKEKLLAARNAGVRTVVIPKLNERDLSEIDRDLKRGLTVHLVDHCEEAIELALVKPRKRKRSASKSRLPRAARGA